MFFYIVIINILSLFLRKFKSTFRFKLGPSTERLKEPSWVNYTFSNQIFVFRLNRMWKGLVARWERAVSLFHRLTYIIIKSVDLPISIHQISTFAVDPNDFLLLLSFICLFVRLSSEKLIYVIISNWVIFRTPFHFICLHASHKKN